MTTLRGVQVGTNKGMMRNTGELGKQFADWQVGGG